MSRPGETIPLVMACARVYTDAGTSRLSELVDLLSSESTVEEAPTKAG